jgi:hypothetical protein
MSLSGAALKAFLVKYVAKPLGGPVTLVRASLAATFSVAHLLLELIDSRVAPDLGRIKESLLRRLEADADGKAAEAQRKVAEAAEAHNRAELVKRQQGIVKAERIVKLAEAAKTQAEAEAIRLDAATRQQQATHAARATLIDAISRVNQQGGGVYFSEQSIRAMLRSVPPPDDEPH